MNASNNQDLNPSNPPKDPKKGVGSGAVITAWCVILFSAIIWINQESLVGWLMYEIGVGAEEVVDAQEPTSQLTGISSPELEVMAKMVVGSKGILPEGLAKTLMSESIDELQNEELVNRVGWSILKAAIGELPQAEEELDELIAENENNPAIEKELMLVRRAVIAQRNGEVLSDTDQTELIDSLGYFGEVAVSLSDTAEQTRLEKEVLPQLFKFMLAVGVYMLVGVSGVVVLLLMCIFAFTGKVKSRLIKTSRPGIYAETFAIWMVLFFALQITVGLLELSPPILMSSVAFFASLSALAWPVIRGHSWSKVRKDIGWYGGKSPWFEPFAGFATWGMAIPFMVIGLMITQLLIILVELLTGTAPTPGHPVQQLANSASGLDLVYLFIAVSLAAPIVEETMFRGVLYAHLRGMSRRMVGILSVGMSMLITSILFAAIHPQGLVFIPPLAGLAIGFCIGREWRGSLLASMFAHGYHNALTISLSLILFS